MKTGGEQGKSQSRKRFMESCFRMSVFKSIGQSKMCAKERMARNKKIFGEDVVAYNV